MQGGPAESLRQGAMLDEATGGNPLEYLFGGATVEEVEILPVVLREGDLPDGCPSLDLENAILQMYIFEN